MGTNSSLADGISAEGMSLPAAWEQPEPEQKRQRLEASLSETLDTSVVAQPSASSTVAARPFTLALGGPRSEGVTCKMMLYAKALKQGKAGQSFKLSGGQGSLQVKCEHDLSGSMRSGASLRLS